MRFHLLHKATNVFGKPSTTPELFRAACDRLGVELVCYRFGLKDAPVSLATLGPLGPDDLLYRSSQHSRAVVAERLMASRECATLRSQWTDVYANRAASWYLHTYLGLPAIPSFPEVPLTMEERDMLVEKLGGYPIIIKVVGQSLGVGVMRLDSAESFNSVLDYVRDSDAQVMLRKYIDHTHYVRAIVVGDRVVASKATYAARGEFRTNTMWSAKRERVPVELPDEQQRVVVRAVRSLGLEAGGVDLLAAADGTYYIAEVNFPFDFTGTQRITGIDIAYEMVSYLKAKAEGMAKGDNPAPRMV